MGMVLRTFICIFLLAAFWAGGLLWFTQRISHYTLAEGQNADAIVVLTGGGGRVEYGLELLANGRGKALFISGVSKNVPLADLIGKAPVDIRQLLDISTVGRITLGHEATNTIGNAQETAAWVKKRKITSLLLVTADYHMPRSVVEFKASLSDVAIIPAVVSTGDYKGVQWLNDEKNRTLILSEYHKLIASQLRHWFIKTTSKANL